MPKLISSHQINYGKRILPIKMIESFFPEEWERFTEEWLDLKKTTYLEIEHFGGAGDKGRDVVAYITDKSKVGYLWDCYQCKHYDNALYPTQIFTEIGKILYYTFIKDYPIPSKYYFVAPKGCGTSLSKLFINPKGLHQEVINKWDKYCKENITDTRNVELNGVFLSYVNGFDYSIF